MAQCSMLEAFSDHLRRFVKRKYGIEVPVVREDAGRACVIERNLGDSGDPWSGETENSEIELIHFNDPGGKAPVKIKLVYALHQLSGQMDNWDAAAAGIREEHIADLTEILSPFFYDDFAIGNYIYATVNVNGKDVERWVRGEKEV